MIDIYDIQEAMLYVPADIDEPNNAHEGIDEDSD